VGRWRGALEDTVGPNGQLIVNLMRTLEVIRKAGARMQEIVLAPLGLDDVDRLVVDSLHCDRDSAHPLAQLVHEKTGGNPFFAIGIEAMSAVMRQPRVLRVRSQIDRHTIPLFALFLPTAVSYQWPR
jgi:hypothetical protein